MATQPSEMSLSVRDDATGLEWAGALGRRGLFPDRRNLSRPAYLRMLTEIPRFHRRAEAAARQRGPRPDAQRLPRDRPLHAVLPAALHGAAGRLGFKQCLSDPGDVPGGGDVYCYEFSRVPSEEEIAGVEEEMEQMTSTMCCSRRSSRSSTSADARPAWRRPPVRGARSATSSRRARRSRRARAAAAAGAAPRARSWRRSRTRSRTCRWPTCSSPADAATGGRKPDGEAEGRPGRRSRQDGCGFRTVSASVKPPR